MGSDTNTLNSGRMRAIRLVFVALRSIVPVVGIVFFAWPGTRLLIVYYFDTCAALAGVIVLIGIHGFADPDPRARAAARTLPGFAKAVLLALLFTAFFAVPLGAPVLFMLLGAAPEVWDELNGLGPFLVLQLTAVASSVLWLHREIYRRHNDERVLMHHAAFIVARWAAVILASFVPFLPELAGPAFLVAAYAGASIAFEIEPGRALRWLNPNRQEQ